MINNYHIYEQNFLLDWSSVVWEPRVGADPAMSSSIRNRFSHFWYPAYNSARVIVAQQQSLVALSQGTDVQCYNYSLPYSFSTVPDVAVGTAPMIQP